MPHHASRTLIVSTSLKISPASKIHLVVNGVGYLEITFATEVPVSLAQYKISSNTVKIPVFGGLSLDLTNVVSIKPVGVVAQLEEHYSGVAGVTAVKVSHKLIKHILLNISSNSVTNIQLDENQVPPVQNPVFFVGDANIEFVGYGVSFNVQDYDPLSQVPAGNAVYIDLTNGSSTNFAEAPANAGIQILKSYTGFIMLSNFNGTGVVHIFLSSGANGSS